MLFVEDFDDLTSLGSQFTSGRMPRVETAEKKNDEEVCVTPAEAEEIKNEAFIAGVAEGRRQAEAELPAQQLAVVKRIEATIPEAIMRLQDEIRQDVHFIADAAFCLIAELLPAFCKQHGPEEVVDSLRGMFAVLLDENSVNLKVHKSLEDVIGRELAASGMKRGQVTLSFCSDIPPGDFRLEWCNGSARRDTGRLQQEMLARLVQIGLITSDREN